MGLALDKGLLGGGEVGIAAQQLAFAAGDLAGALFDGQFERGACHGGLGTGDGLGEVTRIDREDRFTGGDDTAFAEGGVDRSDLACDQRLQVDLA